MIVTASSLLSIKTLSKFSSLQRCSQVRPQPPKAKRRPARNFFFVFLFFKPARPTCAHNIVPVQTCTCTHEPTHFTPHNILFQSQPHPKFSIIAFFFTLKTPQVALLLPWRTNPVERIRSHCLGVSRGQAGRVNRFLKLRMIGDGVLK